MKILITGGAGFIGSHVVRRLVQKYREYRIYNLDALTYAGNLGNLRDLEKEENYKFVPGNILDQELLENLFKAYCFDGIIHLAAESHVDRSISGPSDFVQTNIQGTVNLLTIARDSWNGDFNGKRFYHISTDEVYGSLGAEGRFNEVTPYAPNSPYSASKAASDHFVRAFGITYGLPYMISNCSNNYGPNQFPEKLIPLFIHNIVENKPLPLYGDGKHTRDWLYVEDHAAAIDLVYHGGRDAETYCIGGGNEWKNIDLANMLCEVLDRKLQRKAGTSEKLIKFVKDRPGHDFRYAIDNNKIRTELGWKPSHTFEQGLEKTVDWYLGNKEWLKNVTSGDYQKYYGQQYLG
jgi:dTDP-glucose 4,6-dehydratase